jgi:exodeoxyribonuclease VII large subunit
MDGYPIPRPVVDEKIHTVTEITRDLKRIITTSFGSLWLEGELSGYKRHSSGHHYFTMKDANASISCTCWRGNASRLTFNPQDGMKVQAWGNLDVYEVQGKYQFIVNSMRPAGLGELQQAFELLKKKLQGEGLFDSARKRPLPLFPDTIGLVTSGTGAALQDMKTVAGKRWPAAQLVLCSARVQGEGAAQEIAEAIAAFNRLRNVDVMVVGRGGGSLEDLWPFNEEVVARAIHQSRIPVVSAVGHEVDFTISDFVADVRAATPSAAMEIVLPDRQEVGAKVSVLKRRLSGSVVERVRLLRSRLKAASQHYALRQPVNTVNMFGQRLDQVQTRMITAFDSAILGWRNRLERGRELLNLFRPQAVLQRGYSIVRDSAGNIVRDLLKYASGDKVTITAARGSAEAEIKEVSKSSAI